MLFFTVCRKFDVIAINTCLNRKCKTEKHAGMENARQKCRVGQETADVEMRQIK